VSAITVIIPVYNVAGYLKAAMDSLIAQDVREWNAVCVDDGSTDGSGGILDEYAARDPRFSVVHKRNGGLSSARNAGLEVSTGDVVLFMDPDDVVDPQWMRRLVDGIADVDLAWGGSQSATESGLEAKLAWQTASDVGVEYRGDAVKHRVWRAVFGYRMRDLAKAALPGGLWNRCGREFASVCWRAFRRNVIGDLRFDENVWLYEDAVFLSEYAQRAKSMRVIGYTGYQYFIRPGGMMAAEARDHMTRHRFELRDARRRIDPRMTHWRGSFLLSAVDVLRRSGLAVFIRYVAFRPYAE